MPKDGYRKSRIAGRQMAPETLMVSFGFDPKLSEGAVKTAVHRLRRRFQAELLRQVGETVSSPDEAEDEVRRLIQALHA